MIKWILMSLLVSYIFRRFIFTPLNQSNQSQGQSKNNDLKTKEKPKTKFTDKLGDYTDYEEIK